MHAFQIGILLLLGGISSANAQNAPSNTAPLDFDLPPANHSAPSATDFVQSLEEDLGRKPDRLKAEADSEEESSPAPTPVRRPAKQEDPVKLDDLEVEKMTFTEDANKAPEAGPISAAQRKELVLQTISKYFPTLKKCYVEGLKDSPQMKGKVTLTWALDAQGRVLDPAVQSSQLKNKRVETCMTQRFGEAKFPPQTKLPGSKDRMTYTLQFLPENN